MSVKLSEPAARQIARQLAIRGKGLGLRLSVKKAGCSGFAYVVDYADQIEVGDAVFEEHGVKLIIAGEYLSMLNGLEVDFTREGISEAFRFRNPMATGTCGCGESFTV